MAQIGKRKSIIVKRQEKWHKKKGEHKIAATGSNAPKPGFFSTVMSGASFIGSKIASGAKATFTEENRNRLAGFGERMGKTSRGMFTGMPGMYDEPKRRRKKRKR